MNRRKSSRIVLLLLTLPSLILPPSATLAGVFDLFKHDADGPITLQQAAAYVDAIDRRLFATGTIGVKTPDVWGQNRMTVYRAEFEEQMKTRLANYQDILQAAQSRTDLATLTSATSLGATIAAAQTKGAPVSVVPVAAPTTPVLSTTVVSPSATPAMTTAPAAMTPAAATPAAPAGPGNPDFSGMASQLAAISARLDTLKAGTLTLPTNINTFNNTAGKAGVGIEPTIQLDEEADYINHLHQLRRVNAGDDLTDMAGYGLYLLRMPISLMPGPDSRKGKGAIVTVEARHDLTDDLLPNTFRDVAILDLTYALTQIVNEDIHQDIYKKCHPVKPKKPPAAQPNTMTGMSAPRARDGMVRLTEAIQPDTMTGMSARPNQTKFIQGDPPKNVTGPNPFLIEDLRIILGPLKTPMECDLSSEQELEDMLEQAENAACDVQGATAPPVAGSAFGRATPEEAARKPVEAPRNLDVPTTIPAIPFTNPGASRVKPAGGGLIGKRDEIVKARFKIPATFDATRRYERILSNRLGLLVEAMEASQSDPYRHDPSTLGLFQASILDAYRYMREHAIQVDLFQVPRIEYLGELLLRRNYDKLIDAREQFLYDLYCFRNAKPGGRVPARGDIWEDSIEPSDVLAFALLLQFVYVDRTLKWDMRYMSQRRGCNCGDVGGLFFYEFEPSIEARRAFNEYVACKWPLHIYSVDPVVDQQNVLDAYSRRTELQLALAVAVSTGQANFKNATSFGRQLDLDLQTVGLNRTSVGFGAGDTTFGWMFYPRVQPPQTFSTFRTFTNTLTGTGQGINTDLRGRRIEPGQRECIALMVTPNFIPAMKVSTVTNWFDITGHFAKQQLSNQEMLELSRKLQQAKDAVARACDSREYRATDFTVLNQRIKQLEALLPTHDTRVDLPDEGDLLGSEIFSSNAAGLSPSLLAWYGEPVQDGTAGSIFLQGRGFSVSETQVIVGGIPLIQGTGFKLISRNVMQIIVPANARSVKVQLDHDHDDAKPKAPQVAVAIINTLGGVPALEARGGVADLELGTHQRVQAQLDPKLNPDVNVTVNGTNSSANARGAKVDVQYEGVHVRAQGTPVPPKPTPTKECDRAVIDVHIATPNGISNHLYVEVVPKTTPPTPKNAVTTATTTTTIHGDTSTTTTRFETTPPGTVLPALTILPMGTNWPPGTVLAPGPVTGAPTGSLLPGLVPTAATPVVPPLSLIPAATPAPTTVPAVAPAVAPAAIPTPTTAPAVPTTNTTPAPAAMVPMTPGIPSTATALPAGGMDGQVGVAALQTASILGLPPLPSEAPKAVAAPVTAANPTSRRVRPSILRRIGMPDR